MIATADTTMLQDVCGSLLWFAKAAFWIGVVAEVITLIAKLWKDLKTPATTPVSVKNLAGGVGSVVTAFATAIKDLGSGKALFVLSFGLFFLALEAAKLVAYPPEAAAEASDASASADPTPPAQAAAPSGAGQDE